MVRNRVTMLYFSLYLTCLCLPTVLCHIIDSKDCYINNEQQGTADIIQIGYKWEMKWECIILHPRSSVEYSFEWVIGDKRIRYCSWQKGADGPQCVIDLYLVRKAIGIPMCTVTMKYSDKDEDDGATGSCNAAMSDCVYGREHMNLKTCIFAGNDERMEVGIGPSHHDGESPPRSCHIFTSRNLTATSVKWLLDNKPHGTCRGDKLRNYGNYYYKCDFTEDAVGNLTCLVEADLGHITPGLNHYIAQCLSHPFDLPFSKDNLNINKCYLDSNYELEVGISNSRGGHTQTCHIFTSQNIRVTAVKWLLDNKPRGTCDETKFQNYGKYESYKYYKCDFTEDAVGNLTCVVEGIQWHTTPDGHNYKEQCSSHQFQIPDKTPPGTISIELITAPIDVADSNDCHGNNEYRGTVDIQDVNWDGRKFGANCTVLYPETSAEYSFKWVIGDQEMGYCSSQSGDHYPNCIANFPLPNYFDGRIPVCIVTIMLNDDMIGNCNASIKDFIIKDCIIGKDNLNMKKCAFDGNDEELKLGIWPNYDGQPPSCHIFTSKNLTATSVQWFLDSRPYGTCDGSNLRNYGKYYKCDFTKDAVGNLTCLVEADLWHDTYGLNLYKAQCLSHPFDLPFKTPPGTTSTLAPTQSRETCVKREQPIFDCLKEKHWNEQQIQKWYDRVLNPETRTGSRATQYDQDLVCNCADIDDYLYYGVTPDVYTPTTSCPSRPSARQSSNDVQSGIAGSIGSDPSAGDSQSNKSQK